MMRLTPDQRGKVALFAESLMSSEGISKHTQRALIEIGRAASHKRFEGIWLHPVEIINLSGEFVGTMGHEELEWYINDRLQELFATRDEIDLGPIIVRRELRNDGAFYSFVRNFYALDKISEYEDQLLRDANECPCHYCRARPLEHRRGYDGSNGTD